MQAASCERPHCCQPCGAERRPLKHFNQTLPGDPPGPWGPPGTLGNPPGTLVTLSRCDPSTLRSSARRLNPKACSPKANASEACCRLACQTLQVALCDSRGHKGRGTMKRSVGKHREPQAGAQSPGTGTGVSPCGPQSLVLNGQIQHPGLHAVHQNKHLPLPPHPPNQLVLSWTTHTHRGGNTSALQYLVKGYARGSS